MQITRLIRRLPQRVITWLKWQVAGPELLRLHRMEGGLRDAARLLTPGFPEVDNVLGYIELAANGAPCDPHKLHARMLARRNDSMAHAMAAARRDRGMGSVQHYAELMSQRPAWRQRRSYDTEPERSLGSGCYV